MGKVSLRRLRMIESPMAHCTPSCSKGKTTTLELPTRSVAILSSLVHYLIESRKDIIAELNLSNCSVSNCSDTNSKPCYTLLRKWCIKNSLYSIFFQKPTGTTENTSKFYILAKYFCTTFIIFVYVGSEASATSIAEFID